MFSNYQSFWKAFIRPTRQTYNDSDLGMLRGNFRMQYFYMRTNINIVNRDGQTLVGTLFEPMSSPIATTSSKHDCVVYCHANSGCRIDGLAYLEELITRGIGLFTFDFSGSGLSDGEYVTLGFREQHDLAAVIRHLRTLPQIRSLALFGRSMGAVTALLYAPTDSNIACLVADSPFSNLRELALELAESKMPSIPRFLLDTMLSLINSSVHERAAFHFEDIDLTSAVARTHIPAIFVASEEDHLVASHHSKKLYERYSGRQKELKLIPGNHNEDRTKQYKADIAQFFADRFKEFTSITEHNYLLQPIQNPPTLPSLHDIQFESSLHSAQYPMKKSAAAGATASSHMRASSNPIIFNNFINQTTTTTTSATSLTSNSINPTTTSTTTNQYSSKRTPSLQFPCNKKEIEHYPTPQFPTSKTSRQVSQQQEPREYPNSSQQITIPGMYSEQQVPAIATTEFYSNTADRINTPETATISEVPIDQQMQMKGRYSIQNHLNISPPKKLSQKKQASSKRSQSFSAISSTFPATPNIPSTVLNAPKSFNFEQPYQQQQQQYKFETTTTTTSNPTQENVQKTLLPAGVDSRTILGNQPTQRQTDMNLSTLLSVNDEFEEFEMVDSDEEFAHVHSPTQQKQQQLISTSIPANLQHQFKLIPPSQSFHEYEKQQAIKKEITPIPKQQKLSQLPQKFSPAKQMLQQHEQHETASTSTTTNDQLSTLPSAPRGGTLLPAVQSINPQTSSMRMNTVQQSSSNTLNAINPLNYQTNISDLIREYCQQIMAEKKDAQEGKHQQQSFDFPENPNGITNTTNDDGSLSKVKSSFATISEHTRPLLNQAIHTPIIPYNQTIQLAHPSTRNTSTRISSSHIPMSQDILLNLQSIQQQQEQEQQKQQQQQQQQYIQRHPPSSSSSVTHIRGSFSGTPSSLIVAHYSKVTGTEATSTVPQDYHSISNIQPQLETKASSLITQPPQKQQITGNGLAHPNHHRNLSANLPPRPTAAQLLMGTTPSQQGSPLKQKQQQQTNRSPDPSSTQKPNYYQSTFIPQYQPITNQAIRAMMHQQTRSSSQQQQSQSATAAASVSPPKKSNSPPKISTSSPNKPPVVMGLLQPNHQKHRSTDPAFFQAFNNNNRNSQYQNLPLNNQNNMTGTIQTTTTSSSLNKQPIQNWTQSFHLKQLSQQSTNNLTPQIEQQDHEKYQQLQLHQQQIPQNSFEKYVLSQNNIENQTGNNSQQTNMQYFSINSQTNNTIFPRKFESLQQQQEQKHLSTQTTTTTNSKRLDSSNMSYQQNQQPQQSKQQFQQQKNIHPSSQNSIKTLSNIPEQQMISQQSIQLKQQEKYQEIFPKQQQQQPQSSSVRLTINDTQNQNHSYQQIRSINFNSFIVPPPAAPATTTAKSSMKQLPPPQPSSEQSIFPIAKAIKTTSITNPSSSSPYIPQTSNSTYPNKFTNLK